MTMESITPYEFIAAFGAIAVAVFTGLSFTFNYSLSCKKSHIEKKTKLLELSMKIKHKYPIDKKYDSILKNYIYDYCDQKKACPKLFILCINRPDPEVALESFRISGHLFYFCTVTKKIIRKRGKEAYDIISSILAFIYYTALVLCVSYMSIFFPKNINFENKAMVYSYIIALAILFLVASHSLLTLGKVGKRYRANKKLANILTIKESDLPL